MSLLHCATILLSKQNVFGNQIRGRVRGGGVLVLGRWGDYCGCLFSTSALECVAIILDVGWKGRMLNAFEGRASRAPERSRLGWEGCAVYHNIFSFLYCLSLSLCLSVFFLSLSLWWSFRRLACVMHIINILYSTPGTERWA